MPSECLYLWTLFCELATGEDLSFAEIESWMRLTGHRLAGWEVEVLRGLDRRRRKVSTDGQ